MTRAQVTALCKIYEYRSATGTCINYAWHWTVGGERLSPITIRNLIKAGMAKASYYSNNTAAVSITEAGVRKLMAIA